MLKSSHKDKNPPACTFLTSPLTFLVLQPERSLSFPGRQQAGDSGQRVGGGLHLRRGVLQQHQRAGQRLHSEAARQRSKVCSVSVVSEITAALESHQSRSCFNHGRRFHAQLPGCRVTPSDTSFCFEAFLRILTRGGLVDGVISSSQLNNKRTHLVFSSESWL